MERLRYGEHPYLRHIHALSRYVDTDYASSLSLSKNMRDCRRRLHLSRVTTSRLVFFRSRRNNAADPRFAAKVFFFFFFSFPRPISPPDPRANPRPTRLPSAITSPRSPPRAFPPFHCVGKIRRVRPVTYTNTD